jgi:hypothetical protein
MNRVSAMREKYQAQMFGNKALRTYLDVTRIGIPKRFSEHYSDYCNILTG